MKTMITGLAVALAGLAVAGKASATTFVYERSWNNTLESVKTTYTPSSQLFTWEFTTRDQIAQGFTLALSPGPNPKNNPGQMAFLYFDAKNTSDIAVTAYGYRRQGLGSFIDGDVTRAGNQTPDFIAGTRGTADDSWVVNASVHDVGGKRTMKLTLDASVIQDHIPLYPDPDGDPWTGVAFGEKLGYWFHTRRNLVTSYAADGRLLQWGGQNYVFSDTANLSTITVVPLPPAAWAGLVGLVGAGVLLRRFA